MQEAGATSGGKRDHEDMSHMMALVEAARKVRTITARPCAHGQMGSQCCRRKRLWPSCRLQPAQRAARSQLRAALRAAPPHAALMAAQAWAAACPHRG